MKRLLATLAVLAAGFSTTAAHADPLLAYSHTITPNPLQNFVGDLGLQFMVNNTGVPSVVTTIGAFDNGSLMNLVGANGTSDVQVGIYTQGGTLVPNTLFTLTPTGAYAGTTPGTTPTIAVMQGTGNQAGDAYINLPTPVTLAAGNYVIVTYNDRNYNSNGAPNSTSALESFGGRISFTGPPLNTPGGSSIAFPTSQDTAGPIDRYSAGTFGLSTAAVPEPTTIAQGMALAFLGAGVLAWRRKKSA
jgi:hypothetical protein